MARQLIPVRNPVHDLAKRRVTTLKKTSDRLYTANPVRSLMLPQGGITRRTTLQILSRGRPAILEVPTHSLTKMMTGYEVALGQRRQQFISEHRLGRRLTFRIQISEVNRAGLYHILIRRPRMARNQGIKYFWSCIFSLRFHDLTICILQNRDPDFGEGMECFQTSGPARTSLNLERRDGFYWNLNKVLLGEW